MYFIFKNAGMPAPHFMGIPNIELINLIMKTEILIIEDEPEIRRLLGNILSDDYKIDFAINGQDGLKQTSFHPPAIIILDLSLPDIDGIEVIKQIREWSNVPIIILSAREAENDKVDALEFGADDYLTKPFSAGELLARIKAVMRRQQLTSVNNSAIFESGDLKVDLEQRQVLVKGASIHLTPIEYKILAILIKNAGKIITYKQLLQEIWGKHRTNSNHYLRIYIQHLRQKLQDNPLNPKYIITETAVGYRFKI